MSSILEPPLVTNRGWFGDFFVEVGDAFIKVRHASPWFGRYRDFEVFIDDARVGMVDQKPRSAIVSNPGGIR